MIIYMAMEIQAISIYVMLGIREKGKELSMEASIKYFMMGGISGGLIIYGSGLAYGYVGEMDILTNDALIAGNANDALIAGNVGKGMITIGLLIKLAAAPMHM